MIGIYKFTNKINGHSYIGQSIDIEKRKKSHIQRAFCNTESNKEYNKSFYCAIRKYGIENFSFEILKICAQDELNDWEKYFISFYDTYNHGYNEDEGGGMFLHIKDGEKHPRHKLTEMEVYNIREAYSEHQMKEEVYEKYKDKIGPSGFHKIWNGETWTKVRMDVFTEENKAFHRLMRNSHPGKGTGRRVSINEIREIRRRSSYETLDEVYKDFKGKIAREVFRKIYNKETYKGIE